MASAGDSSTARSKVAWLRASPVETEEAEKSEKFGPSLGSFGSLEVRLATTKKEIRKAQRLRYKVFYEEGGAKADRPASLIRRDICPYDAACLSAPCVALSKRWAANWRLSRDLPVIR